jgi:DNA-binding response OmpR family regulator
MSKPLVLVVEDEPMIAFSISDALEAAGFEVAGPFPSSRTALECLQTRLPDIGLIDFNLGDNDDSRPVAIELGRASVPFMVLSSYSRTLLDDSLEQRPAAWLMKPVNFDDLPKVLRRELSRTG